MNQKKETKVQQMARLGRLAKKSLKLINEALAELQVRNTGGAKRAKRISPLKKPSHSARGRRRMRRAF